MEISNIAKKAIIVEYEYHFGFLDLLIKVLLFGGYDIDVYCSKRFILFCKKNRYVYKNVRLISEYSPTIGTFKAIKLSKNVHIFIHFSVQAHKFSTFVRLLKPKAQINVLYTPRISNWHDQNFNLSLTKKDFINNYFNIFRYFIKKKYDFYIVHSKQTAEYVELHSKRKVISLPYTVRQESTLQIKDKSEVKNLKVTILGSIDKERRDYLSIFDFNILKKFDLSNVIFELAGVPNGSNYASKNNKDDYFEEIKYLSKKISKVSGCEFKFYNKRLSDIAYVKAIINADILLMPITIKNYKLGQWSAGLAESIEYDKRVIIPESYEVPFEYASDYFTYKNTIDMVKKFKMLANNKSRCILSDLEKIKRKGEFGLEKVSQKFFGTL